MASNEDDPGASAGRPGEPAAAKRPYATIEVTAREGEAGGAAAATAGRTRAGVRMPWPGARWMHGAAALRARVAAAAAGGGRRRIFRSLMSHAAAGATGALVLLLLAPSFTAPARVSAPQEGELARRVGELEAALARRNGAPATSSARLEELARAVAALSEAQANLKRESTALTAASGAGAAAELHQRVARLEAGLAAASLARPPGQTSEDLLARLAEVERSAQQTRESVASAFARGDAERAAARADAARLAERLGTLKQSTEEQLQGAAHAADVAALGARLAAVQQQLRALLGSEAERTVHASRLLLALEFADVKRAADRGEGFAAELGQLKKTAGSSLDVAVLERYTADGAPTLQDLANSFRSVAGAMVDAEEVPPDASVLSRLLAGARSVVRVRRLGHARDDNSTEAVIERMEAALRQGRLADAVGYAENLPPKASGAAADWIAKAQARLAVDRELERMAAALKDALAGRAATDAPR